MFQTFPRFPFLTCTFFLRFELQLLVLHRQEACSRFLRFQVLTAVDGEVPGLLGCYTVTLYTDQYGVTSQNTWMFWEPRQEHCQSDVWLTVHRNSVWIRKTN